MNRALTLKWFAVLGLASLFYLLAPRDVSPQMPLYLGMISAAVIIWTFDLLPAVAVAAALTFLYLLTNMAPPEVVLGPWTTVLIWTTFGAAIFGEAMEKTGLAKRVALRCMLLTGGTFTGMLIGFAIGGIILGLLLASGVIGFFSAVLSNEAFISWGWRIAFIMSAGLLFVGSYIRSSVHETKDFAEAKAKMPEVKYPLLDAFKRYPKMMVACMGARLIDGVAFNTFAVFSLSYLTQTRGLERSSALAVVMIASVVMSFFIPFWGYVADRIGKARVFGFCALLLGILGFPAFWVFHNYSDNYLYVCLALALPFGVVYAAVFGTMSSLFSDSFDPSVRYSAISFVYQFSGIFAAGLTPMVATMLVAWNGGEPWYLCAYLGSAGLISAACTLWIRHLNRKGFPPALPVEGETPVSEPLMEGESA